MQLDTETDNTAQAELLSLTLVLSTTHPSGTSVHSTSTHAPVHSKSAHAPVRTHQVPIHQCALNKYSCTSVHLSDWLWNYQGEKHREGEEEQEENEVWNYFTSWLNIFYFLQIVALVFLH